jgi:hypothetical protein
VVDDQGVYPLCQACSCLLQKYEGKGAKKLNLNFGLSLVSDKMNKTNYPDWFLEKIKDLSQDESDEWFDRKYPDACCHRCEEKLSSDTVVMCGGGGGDCETWYCAACHEEGTDDCDVCAAMNNEDDHVHIDGCGDAEGYFKCPRCKCVLRGNDANDRRMWISTGEDHNDGYDVCDKCEEAADAEEAEKKQDKKERLEECEGGRKRQQAKMLEEFWEKNKETDFEEEGIEWFNRKYPHATCHRCEEKLDGETVVNCGGGGGECETWYCAACHEEGTDDCEVCAMMEYVLKNPAVINFADLSESERAELETAIAAIRRVNHVERKMVQ